MISMLAIGAAAVVVVGVLAVVTRDENYRIDRSVKINAKSETIFAVLRDFRQFEHWSPWEKLDPQMHKTFEGETGAAGSYYHWSGNKQVGEGTMTMLDTQKDEGVDLRIEFFRPFPSQATVRWSIAPAGDGSQVVTWTMKGKHPNLVAKAAAPMVSSMLAKNFDEGLGRLKQRCEKG
jgi:hypothetical protein